jgi:predicted dehydrogenase
VSDAPTFGLVGCGNWGRLILRDLRALGCPVVAVARSAESRARALDGGARVVSHLDEADGLDAVIVATPTSRHGPHVEDALALGVPVFVEKLIALEPALAARLAAGAGERLFVMYQWRYHPGIEALAAVVRAGTLGRLVGVRITWTSWRRAQPDIDEAWVQVPHGLAIVQEIVGAIPAPVAARADRDATGATGLTALLGTDPWIMVDASARAASRTRRVEVVGRDGIALLDGAAATEITVFRGGLADRPDGPEVETRPIVGDQPLARQLAAYVDHLSGGPPPRGTAAEGVAITETMVHLRTQAGLDPTGPGVVQNG